MHSNTETEVKIAVPSLTAVRTKLRASGFRQMKARVFEANELFDTKGATLRGSGCLLRVRTVGRKSIVTYKGQATIGRHKSREELEMIVPDEPQFRRILDRLGYQPGFRYEKYRAEYTDMKGIVTLDETPIGSYIELEGAEDWIDRTAALLGFSDSDYITKSYGRLYLEHCDRNGIVPGNMVFERPTSVSESPQRRSQPPRARRRR